MRHVQFTITDGRTVDLEVQPRFEQLVRERFGMDLNAYVSDADLKRFFLQSCAKAGE